MDPFEAAWLRSDRAEEHRKALTEVWNDFIDQHPFDATLVDEAPGVFVLRVTQELPMPPELSILTGEWLYNLRTALDYTIWAAAVCQSGQAPPPSEEVLQYPIYDTPKAWKNNLRRLEPLANHQVRMLEQMQPFNSRESDANYLGWLNELARIDRHRRFNVFTARVVELKPVFGFDPGSSATLQFGERVLIDGFADVARIKVDPWKPGDKFEVNPRMGIDPEIADWARSPFWRSISYNERFRMFQIFVRAEIAVYEYDCTGDSREPGFLMDTFKEESDRRRKWLQIVERRRPDPEWGPAEQGRPVAGPVPPPA